MLKNDFTEKASSNPRHATLALELAAEIAAGLYPLGSKFPTEWALQERFAVGRHTIREALKILTEQGLLARRRKTGTVVLALRPVSQYVHSLRDIHSLLDFARATFVDIQYEGFVRTTDGWSDDPAEKGESRWYRIAGVRSTRREKSTLCWSEILVPDQFAPDRMEVRRGDRAVYEIVLDQYGLKLEYVEQKVSATKLSARFASLLDAEGGGSGLLVERRYVANTGATYEISRNLYPADRYSIRTIIRQRS